ncbi:hypothetical protein BGY98DRAFT_1033114, partial [Russula aff. rugulosa BPL654]
RHTSVLAREIGRRILLHLIILGRVEGISHVCTIVTRYSLLLCAADILLVANTNCFYRCSNAGHGLNGQSRVRQSFETAP